MALRLGGHAGRRPPDKQNAASAPTTQMAAAMHTLASANGGQATSADASAAPNQISQALQQIGIALRCPPIPGIDTTSSG